jgi:hypothetical protein
MEVGEVRVDDSPAKSDRVRLRATVKYARGDAEEYWYDVPRSHMDELSRTGNPWLASLLPLAATLGESLTLPLPVDAALHKNAARLMRIWKTWYPNLSEPPVHADVETAPVASSPNRVGAFFSGGADSFFTLLRDRSAAAPAERRPIQDLITVWGFDIGLDRPDAFARLRDRHTAVAEQLGKALIDVATNLRSTRWSEAQWSYLAHGAGLASIALALEKRLSAVYIAGGGGYRGLHPWGSHSVTDPLLSTRDTAIVYDGVAYLRTEKLEAISASPVALGALRVCYETWTDENCGKCNKCLRTMIALDLCGALEACTTLPHPADLLKTVARMDCSHFADFREFEDLRRLAVAKGRDDMVKSLDRSVRRTKLRQAVTVGRRLLGAPVHRLAAALRSRADV